MYSTIEELTIAYEEDGIEVIRELDKAVLTKGTWATLVFRYQQWEPAKEAYSEDKYTIRRYRKMNGEYRAQSKFNISGQEQAHSLIAILEAWLNGEPAPAPAKAAKEPAAAKTAKTTSAKKTAPAAKTAKPAAGKTVKSAPAKQESEPVKSEAPAKAAKAKASASAAKAEKETKARKK